MLESELKTLCSFHLKGSPSSALAQLDVVTRALAALVLLEGGVTNIKGFTAWGIEGIHIPRSSSPKGGFSHLFCTLFDELHTDFFLVVGYFDVYEVEFLSSSSC